MQQGVIAQSIPTRFKVRHMKRLLLITLLVLSSGPAYGEWVSVYSNDQDDMTIYLDPDTIRREGDLVKIWGLYDYKTARTAAGISHLSLKNQSEYDCTEERTRMLAFTEFSGNMGKGDVVFSNSDEQKWKPVAPGSVGQTLWKAACAKE
jgi:hypothetical protein